MPAPYSPMQKRTLGTTLVALAIVVFFFWLGITDFVIPEGHSLLALPYPTASGIVTNFSSTDPLCTDVLCIHNVTVQFAPSPNTLVTIIDREPIFTYHTGEHVVVRYNRANPHDAVLARNPIIASGILLGSIVVFALVIWGGIYVMTAKYPYARQTSASRKK